MREPGLRSAMPMENDLFSYKYEGLFGAGMEYERTPLDRDIAKYFAVGMKRVLDAMKGSGLDHPDYIMEVARRGKVLQSFAQADVDDYRTFTDIHNGTSV